jgi:hypothetical protein
MFAPVFKGKNSMKNEMFSIVMTAVLFGKQK